MVVQVNIQLGEYTLNRHRLQLLPSYLAKYGDFQVLYSTAAQLDRHDRADRFLPCMKSLFGQEREDKRFTPFGGLQTVDGTSAAEDSSKTTVDISAAFGMHCAEVKTTEFRQWFRLVGRRYDVQHWAP